MLSDLYRRRDRYTLLGFLSMLTPFPGIGLGCFLQAKAVDRDIKRIVTNKEKCEVCCKFEEDKVNG